MLSEQASTDGGNTQLRSEAVCRICQMGMVCRHAEDLLLLLKIMAGPPDPKEEGARARMRGRRGRTRSDDVTV